MYMIVSTSPSIISSRVNLDRCIAILPRITVEFRFCALTALPKPLAFNPVDLVHEADDEVVS